MTPRALKASALILAMAFTLRSQSGKAFVFEHVNVVPMTRNVVLADYSVVVRNDKIEQMGASSTIKAPKHAIRIDGRDKYLIPALSDMHVHLEGDAWNLMFPKEKKFTSEEIDFRDILFLYVANGITTIDVLFAFPEHLALREKIRKQELPGPRMVLSRMIDGAGKAWPPPLGVWIHNPAEAEDAVIEAHRQGYDRIKVYSFLDLPSYDAIMRAGKKLGMPVDGHIPFAVSVEHAVASGQGMIAHAEEIMKAAKENNPESIRHYASLLAASPTYVTSALITNKNINAVIQDPVREFSKPGTEFLHPMGLGIWNYVYLNLYKPIPKKHRDHLSEGYESFLKPFVREFHRRGGKLLAGTDAPIPSTLPGFALHDELAELVVAGLSPYEALRVSTTNAHDFLGERALAGTLEPGKAANVVLLDGNPLDAISNTRKISGVMTQGQWLSRADIDRRLADIKDAYAKLKAKKAIRPMVADPL
ncbi:amidohydrolase family protein [Geothrix fermentans]|uniref:amidohydrolase family protein n=1 Tax=Geothrix fermentans TaxID=44676 RepID=UPI0004026FC0|nr:amidohydrolase family protein [Geothrix fermentans]